MTFAAGPKKTSNKRNAPDGPKYLLPDLNRSSTGIPSMTFAAGPKKTSNKRNAPDGPKYLLPDLSTHRGGGGDAQPYPLLAPHPLTPPPKYTGGGPSILAPASSRQPRRTVPGGAINPRGELYRGSREPWDIYGCGVRAHSPPPSPAHTRQTHTHALPRWVPRWVPWGARVEPSGRPGLGYGPLAHPPSDPGGGSGAPTLREWAHVLIPRWEKGKGLNKRSRLKNNGRGC